MLAISNQHQLMQTRDQKSEGFIHTIITIIIFLFSFQITWKTCFFKTSIYFAVINLGALWFSSDIEALNVFGNFSHSDGIIKLIWILKCNKNKRQNMKHQIRGRRVDKNSRP